jgi:signal transduction histidine kinase
MVRIAQVCAEQLLLLINDILDLTKMQANKMTLEKNEFSLFSVIKESLEVVSFAAAHKGGLEMAWELDDSLSVGDMIVGDALRLRQSKIFYCVKNHLIPTTVLVNLLSNAIKFSSSGVILLRASVKSQHDEELEIQISVADQVHDFICTYILNYIHRDVEFLRARNHCYFRLLCKLIHQ